MQFLNQRNLVHFYFAGYFCTARMLQTPCTGVMCDWYYFTILLQHSIAQAQNIIIFSFKQTSAQDFTNSFDKM